MSSRSTARARRASSSTISRGAAHAGKSYDAAYFARWYGDPRSRVQSANDVARKARLALAAAEYVLQRRVRRVLDVGCGEGAWFPVLRRLRPGVEYVGVDASEWAVRRWGHRRRILQGAIEHLDRVPLRGRFDLIVCADVLHYLSPAAVQRGLRHVRARLGGVAFLETYTGADEIEGDLDGWRPRPPGFYRAAFRRAGLIPCGLHCWAAPALAPRIAALERAR